MAFTLAPFAARFRPLALPLLAVVFVAACGSGSSGGNDKAPGTSEPPAPTNRAPTISGTPPTTATVGTPYDFMPLASDPDGDTLRFEITGQPAWATFDPNSGRVYGTPAAGNIGTFAGITVTVTDGRARASLPAYSITVSGSVATGSAQLTWTKPTLNIDGSPLTDLAGFRIYYGRLPDAPSERLEIANPGATAATIGGLTTGTWYFSIASYTSAGVESDRTRPVWTTI